MRRIIESAVAAAIPTWIGFIDGVDIEDGDWFDGK
jgi:hypothetical protein